MVVSHRPAVHGCAVATAACGALATGGSSTASIQTLGCIKVPSCCNSDGGCGRGLCAGPVCWEFRLERRDPADSPPLNRTNASPSSAAPSPCAGMSGSPAGAACVPGAAACPALTVDACATAGAAVATADDITRCPFVSCRREMAGRVGAWPVTASAGCCSELAASQSDRDRNGDSHMGE